MRSIWYGLVLCLILGTGLSAADKTKSKAKNASQPYAVGDRVEVQEAGNWVAARVTGYKPNGFVEVELEEDPLAKLGVEPPPGVDTSAFRQRTLLLRQTRRMAADKGKAKPVKGGTSGQSGSRSAGKKSAKPRGDLVEWTDKTGKFKVKARFVQLEDDKVTLEKDDGKTVTMAVSKLNDEGQKLARKLADDLAENPFESGEEAGGDEPEQSPGGSAGAGTEPVPGDWGHVLTLRGDFAGGWSVAPDSGEPVQGTARKSIALHANKNQDAFFEKLEGVAFSPSSLVAAAAIVDGHPSRDTVVGIQRIDLAAGKAEPVVALNLPVRPVAVSPSGSLFAAISDFHLRRGKGSTEAAVAVYRWEGKQPQLVKIWRTYGPKDFHKTDPESATFIDDNHLLTMAFPSRLVMWEISSGKAVYEATLVGGGKPALSPGRKYLACPLETGVCLFDALTGEALGTLPGGNPGAVSAISFRPDGLRLAALSSQRLMVFDLQKGEIERDIYLSKAISADSVEWLQEGYVLCGGQHLIDLEKRVVLWQYTRNGASRGDVDAVLGPEYWYALEAPDKSARALFHTSLPHPTALQTAAKLKGDELLAIRPGATIALQWSVQGQQNEQQAAYQSMVKQLQDIGMTYAEKSRLVLQVSTEVGKSKEITYGSFGRFGGGEKATTTEQISRVRFVEDGNVIWEAMAVSGAPFVLHLKQGETVQQALAKYQQPNLAFFSQIKLPNYVARPHPSGAYGKSELTAQGVQDLPQK